MFECLPGAKTWVAFIRPSKSNESILAHGDPGRRGCLEAKPRKFGRPGASGVELCPVAFSAPTPRPLERPSAAFQVRHTFPEASPGKACVDNSPRGGPAGWEANVPGGQGGAPGCCCCTMFVVLAGTQAINTSNAAGLGGELGREPPGPPFLISALFTIFVWQMDRLQWCL